MKSLKNLEVELQQSIKMPDEIEVLKFLGRGRRSFSYKARYDGHNAVIKVYRKEFIEKYDNKCNIDIAEFEFERNTTLYNIEQIRHYIARPFKVFAKNSSYTHSFIQEYVEGITLKQLIAKLGYLPSEVLDAGYKIVRNAESFGVHDLDISVGNILVVEENEGWAPKLYDFNLLPQHMSPPNFIMAAGIKLGLRNKSHRDYRSLKNWQRRGKQMRWLGKN